MSERNTPPVRSASARPTRWWFAVLAYLFLALALAGIALPGLPTFPFLLLAAWAASRGSRRLHDWLYQHPRFGPRLIEWRDQRAISARAKTLAVSLLALSWVLLGWRVRDPRVLVPLALLFSVVALYLLTRPEPNRRSAANNATDERRHTDEPTPPA